MTLYFTYQTPDGVTVKTTMDYRPDFAEWSGKDQLDNWQQTWDYIMKNKEFPEGTKWLSFEWPKPVYQTVTNPNL